MASTALNAVVNPDLILSILKAITSFRDNTLNVICTWTRFKRNLNSSKFRWPQLSGHN